MEQRTIERLGRSVSVVGLGTWQLGADWGDVAPEDAMGTLNAAVAALRMLAMNLGKLAPSL